MDDPVVVLVATVVIIAASAFFVAIEFALIAAKRHRLEGIAADSRAGRAALRSASELSVLLAGAQLGITLCVLALGAVTKPAVHHWLTPAFESAGLPYWGADVVGFVLALVVVTFLHLVVGEMAPKSWAIAHPERSAALLALPMRGFLWLTRPLLVLLNNSANFLLRRVGVEAVDALSAGQDADDLRALVKHSRDVGALDASFSEQLSGALDLGRVTIGDIAHAGQPVAVGSHATVAEVQQASLDSGHLRILVRADEGLSVVHVRDTITRRGDEPVTDLARPAHLLSADMTVLEALARMRDDRAQLAVFPRDSDHGVVTIADMLRGLVPRSA